MCMLKTNSSTIFAYSLSPRILGSFLLVWGMLLFGILRFVLPSIINSIILVGLLLTLLVFAISIASFMANWTQPVRSAQFYEDGFRIVGRGLDRELKYSDIAHATLVSELTPFLPSRHINIRTNRDDDLIIWGNPKNRKLGLDLYSWLATKTVQLPASGNVTPS